MKKHFAVLYYLFLFGIGGNFVFGQHDSLMKQFSKNSVFVEYSGNGGSDDGMIMPEFSINYDRIFREKRRSKTSIRIGANFPYWKYNGKLLLADFKIPVMLNLFIGKNKFFFEIGAGGQLVCNYFYTDPFVAFTSVIGFRYQNFKRGIMCRLGITPTLGRFSSTPPYVGNIAGASIGYSF